MNKILASMFGLLVATYPTASSGRDFTRYPVVTCHYLANHLQETTKEETMQIYTDDAVINLYAEKVTIRRGNELKRESGSEYSTVVGRTGTEIQLVNAVAVPGPFPRFIPGTFTLVIGRDYYPNVVIKTMETRVVEGSCHILDITFAVVSS